MTWDQLHLLLLSALAHFFCYFVLDQYEVVQGDYFESVFMTYC